MSTNNFTKLFSGGKSYLSGGQTAPAPTPDPGVPSAPFPTATQFLTDVVVQEDEKGVPWLVKCVIAWNAQTLCWEEKAFGIRELPRMIKANTTPDKTGALQQPCLPDFNGVIQVLVPDPDSTNPTDTVTQDLVGGEQIPEGMLGAIFVFGDQTPCYFADTPYECPIQLGGNMPEDPHSVKLWLDGTDLKAPIATDGSFVEVSAP